MSLLPRKPGRPSADDLYARLDVLRTALIAAQDRTDRAEQTRINGQIDAVLDALHGVRSRT